MKPLSNFKSPTTATSTPLYKRPLRIADVLLSDDDLDGAVFEEEQGFVLMAGSSEDRSSCSNVSCVPPRQIVARWFSGLRWRRVKGKREKERQRQREDEKRGLGDCTVQERCSINGRNGQDIGNSASEGAPLGESRKEAAFNLGVGCCLLYLIAASRNELSKVMKLRMQMEMLLHSTDKELRKKDAISELCETNDKYAYLSTMNGLENEDFKSHSLPSQIVTTSEVLPEPPDVTVCSQSLKCKTSNSVDCIEGMDQLEVELEAELILLQKHLDRDNLLKHPQEPQIGVTIKDSTSLKSHTSSPGEIIDPEMDHEEAFVGLDFGVSPYELERRLHELLESRQQEQIRDSEAVIEHLKQKLHEKELEVYWWKDTAKLISQHLPKHFRFTSEQDTNA